MVQISAIGPLSQINSLIKTHNQGDSKKSMSVKQEREQLYEAYNLLHSLAQVRGYFSRLRGEMFKEGQNLNINSCFLLFFAPINALLIM